MTLTPKNATRDARNLRNLIPVPAKDIVTFSSKYGRRNGAPSIATTITFPAGTEAGTFQLAAMNLPEVIAVTADDTCIVIHRAA